MLEKIHCEAVYLTHRPWDAPYLSAAALLRFLPESTDPQWRAEHLALPPCAECPHHLIPSSLPLRQGGVDLEGQQVGALGAGGQPAEDWEGWIDFSASEGEAQYNQHVGRMDLATRLLEEEQGEPAPCAVSIPIAPTSRPPPSSRQPELSKAVKTTPGINSVWNSNANF